MHGTLDPVFRLKSWRVRKYKERFYISCDEHPKQFDIKCAWFNEKNIVNLPADIFLNMLGR